jgi:dienelactone hydrolase
VILRLDFEQLPEGVKLSHGAKLSHGSFGGALEFTNALSGAELAFSHRLDGIKAASIGGWFFVRRSGEGAFLSRGLPEIAPLGERRFSPAKGWVNFLLGTDQHGFLLGCVNGNGEMPFPLVTLDEVGIDAWHQLVYVKEESGGQRWYDNGVLVHTDADSCWAGKVWPFQDGEEGEPLRLAMPQGGLIGEVWIAARAVTDAEVLAEFEAKKARYHPAIPPVPVAMREMDEHHAAGLWREPPTVQSWPKERERILAGVEKILGPFPDRIEPLDPQTLSEEDCGTYVRRKVSIAVQPGDRMPAWLLVPKKLPGRVPAIICFYGTTGGAGKDTTVGLSGPKPGTPPRKNRAFAVDMAEAGFVALAPDYLRDGERVPPGGKPYDTTDFYQKFPQWSCVGKDVWDNMSAVDYLQSLPFVDAEKIGMVGHSYGGHSTIFAAALEPRIKAAFASGPVSDFLHHGIHWGVPPGSGGSASLPGLRPYVLDHTLPLPVTFYEFTALIAPRPLFVCQAVGERRPMEEENCAAVRDVYRALGADDRVEYQWIAGDHDFPPAARKAAVEWFRRWLR